jgi:hypothetical protein
LSSGAGEGIFRDFFKLTINNLIVVAREISKSDFISKNGRKQYPKQKKRAASAALFSA